ncbi:hypothetical protein EG329_012758 [Mollisiaceae sp. DMI_Dod_QoI]|nr:hypothetical protein EG329_012758 [Helotiales sp. DMI_Dod_QoI]
MAAYLSMASFLPIGIPIFVNHQARLSPTTSSPTRSSDTSPPNSTFDRMKDQQATGEEGLFSKVKMSIFASQPMQAAVSVPPPSYSSTRHQPPPYLPPASPNTSTSTSKSNSKTWFGSIFGSRTTLPQESQTSLQATPGAASTSTPEVNLTPLPPSYNSNPSPTTTTTTTTTSTPRTRELTHHPSSSSSTLSISTLSTLSTTSTITTQPTPSSPLPKYEAIQTPSSKQLTRTSTTTSPSTSTSRSSTQPKPNKKPTWSNPYISTDHDYVDPYEEYELRQRADRDRDLGREEGNGDWCCGCFWVGPAHPWQAYYVF